MLIYNLLCACCMRLEALLLLLAQSTSLLRHPTCACQKLLEAHSQAIHRYYMYSLPQVLQYAHCRPSRGWGARDVFCCHGPRQCVDI